MNRRSFIKGTASFLAAPAIVQVANIMPVVARPALVARTLVISDTGEPLIVQNARGWYLQTDATGVPSKTIEKPPFLRGFDLPEGNMIVLYRDTSGMFPVQSDIKDWFTAEPSPARLASS